VAPPRDSPGALGNAAVTGIDDIAPPADPWSGGIRMLRSLNECGAGAIRTVWRASLLSSSTIRIPFHRITAGPSLTLSSIPERSIAFSLLNTSSRFRSPGPRLLPAGNPSRFRGAPQGPLPASSMLNICISAMELFDEPGTPTIEHDSDGVEHFRLERDSVHPRALEPDGEVRPFDFNSASTTVDDVSSAMIKSISGFPSGKATDS
jgi:hypothetical protein